MDWGKAGQSLANAWNTVPNGMQIVMRTALQRLEREAQLRDTHIQGNIDDILEALGEDITENRSSLPGTPPRRPR